MSSEIFWRSLVAKRTSRLVRMPTSLPVTRPPAPPLATTGMPEIRLALISASASASVASGPMVMGFTTMPLSKLLTCRTCSACSAGSKLRWMTPMPPACAIAIAIWCSVTVSIAALRIGRLSSMSLVTRLRILTSVGSTSERAGCSSTSSNVSAASPVMDVMIFAKDAPFRLASENRKPAPATRSLARVGEGHYHRPRQMQRADPRLLGGSGIVRSARKFGTATRRPT